MRKEAEFRTILSFIQVRNPLPPPHTPPDHQVDAILGPSSLAKRQHGQQALREPNHTQDAAPTCAAPPR